MFARHMLPAPPANFFFLSSGSSKRCGSRERNWLRRRLMTTSLASSTYTALPSPYTVTNVRYIAATSNATINDRTHSTAGHSTAMPSSVPSPSAAALRTLRRLAGFSSGLSEIPATLTGSVASTAPRMRTKTGMAAPRTPSNIFRSLSANRMEPDQVASCSVWIAAEHLDTAAPERTTEPEAMAIRSASPSTFVASLVALTTSSTSVRGASVSCARRSSTTGRDSTAPVLPFLVLPTATSACF
mmetsp:Transcript_31429/g.71832  ORF Transcript_31429/g.71832 Transcript_31429/m.71832 type:complete len:243 (+) Transcript_31429:4572-5300(+)